MLLRTLLLPFLPLAALPLVAMTSQATKDAPPPGLVLIPGGKTEIGIDKKEVERLLTEYPPLRSTASLFIGETPKKSHTLPDFFLMVTEVTNEQYAAYVSAANARPPYHWADGAVTAARDAFLAEQAARRAAAVAAGEKVPPMEKFNEREWWAGNWRGQPWQIPAGLERMPVVYVDFQDAEGYARWAGLRLMTELEYQRACRGDTDQMYPWGDRWEDGKYAATQELNRPEVMLAGSFPDGANKFGVMDLAGNAWEWTDSKYVALEGYKYFTLEFGRGGTKETYDKPPPFNPDYRSVVGGSVQNPRFMARCTTRGGYDRFQQASALGFRCAASTLIGFDMAETLAREVPVELRPQDKEGPIKYDPRLTLALDRWKVAAENAQTRAQQKALEEAERKKATATPDEASELDEVPLVGVAGYEVIEDYDYILFLPVERIGAVYPKDLRANSIEDGLVPIGLLATNQELVEPALPPGSYVVSFRGKGEPPPPPTPEDEKKNKKKKGKKDEEKPDAEQDKPDPEAPAPQEGEAKPEEKPKEPPIETRIQIDLLQDNFVLFDLTGQPVCAIPCESLTDAAIQPGAIEKFDETITKMVGEKEVEEVQKWMAFQIFIKGKSSKGFVMKLPLRFADGVIDGTWRQ